MNQTIAHIDEYSKPGTKLLLREGTGILDRYCVNEKYSEALGTFYIAVYRTRDEYISAFGRIGFKAVKDENFFHEGSSLNNFPETRLRRYLFEKC